MPPTDVVADASVAVKWFYKQDEEEVAPARTLLTHHRNRHLLVQVLDLTRYELGNALMRGRAGFSGEATAVVLEVLTEMCPTIATTPKDLRRACAIAAEHDLTLYDATYAAVAQRRDALLATHDGQLLESGLGQRPGEVLATLGVAILQPSS